MGFPFYKQIESKDCGPTCLRMICKYYKKTYSLQLIKNKCEWSKEGVSFLSLCKVAEELNFKTLASEISVSQLEKHGILPCILHWDRKHFVVLYKIERKIVIIGDPSIGIIKISRNEFEQHWLDSDKANGIALFLEPTALFNNTDDEADVEQQISFAELGRYFIKYKRLFFQLSLGFLIGAVLQLMIPFLTQAVVDVGINTRDIDFITLLLVGQLMIFLGSAIVDFTRSWLLLHISTRINISLLTSFFTKLMRLPLSFFDSKIIGDLMQRIGDYGRIQNFLTNTLLTFTFAVANFVVYTVIVVTYDVKLFLVFIVGTLIYFGWIMMFLKIRKVLDQKRFKLAAKNQSITIQLIQGMQEIKLNNSEMIKRWEWERNQAKSFKLSMRSLTINQIQQAGAVFINQGKNVVITYMTAKQVLSGDLTLGGMLAIQYIIGQLSGPLQQMIGFTQSLQDAKISMERVNEIHGLADEEVKGRDYLTELPSNKDILISDVSYKYSGGEKYVLQKINLRIPQNKVTAIVGMSGSGKTTLLKLLLKYYSPTEGTIKIGESSLDYIQHSFWRRNCGVVMQDGYIFSDSIAQNIAVGEEYPNIIKVQHAATVANIHEFVESLPLSYNTKIGHEGVGLSQGQRQRILIARAVYKDPAYLFFDEATNALDANNERIIMDNFLSFFRGRTVIVVAHRLSTVVNADQIIVFDKGAVLECGTHADLVSQEGKYFQLIKNQLELGA